MNNKKFNLDILTKLGTHHKKIMEMVRSNINNMNTNKELYNFVNNYLIEHSINKAFPIGISINEIIAHDSYHKDNKIKFNNSDLIKVDIGMEEDGNIIDSARTFIYTPTHPAATTPVLSTSTLSTSTNADGAYRAYGADKEEDLKAVGVCREIVKNVEIFIRNEYATNKKINIQKISNEIYNNITANGYHALDFLGGHTIEHGKVHGKKLILNKPLTHLPEQCKSFINPNDELVEGEMFAIEVFIPNKKTNGYMMQNDKLLITHYELNDKLVEAGLVAGGPGSVEAVVGGPGSVEAVVGGERDVLKDIATITKGLPYEYRIHDKYDKYIIKSLITKGYIKKHLPLQWVDRDKKKIKYIHDYKNDELVQGFADNMHVPIEKL
jgi:methionine aminopeptidase